MRRGVLLAVLFVLAACQFTLPGRSTSPDEVAAAATANPITGDVVEVTSLDAPKAPEASVASPPASGAAVTNASVTAPPSPVPDTPPEAPPTEPAAAVTAKSPAQVACERKKGVWTQAGSAGAAFCQRPTRDGGKVCRAATDCEGYCLARSRTCAPITPMFGCQEILNENGRVLTQCLN